MRIQLHGYSYGIENVEKHNISVSRLTTSDSLLSPSIVTSLVVVLPTPQSTYCHSGNRKAYSIYRY